MKKKFIFLCVAALCVLLLGCVAFAACDPKETAESGFKVTLDFDSQKGDVTLSKPAEGELYDAGETATVTVSPKEGWQLDTFTVSGYDDAALNGGGYTFEVKADTTVTVTFKNDVDYLFNSLKGSIRFTGKRIEKNYLSDTETEADFNIVYDTAKKAVLFESFVGANPLRIWLYQADKDGNAVEIYHDMQGNVVHDPHSSSLMTFSEIDNPFNYLTSENLKHIEDNKWTLDIDDKTYYDLSSALFAYPSYVESFTLYEENGVFVRFECALERITAGTWTDEQYFFDFDISEHGTAAITDEEYFQNYVLTENHKTLKSAMEEASKAKNYTVKYQTENEEYTLYYTENGIYIDEQGKERGYVARPDGQLWKYYYDPENRSFDFDSPLEQYNDIQQLKAYFTFNNGDEDLYIMLKDLGNGKFSTRPLDVNTTYNELSDFFSQQIATGEEQIEMFSYPYNFSVSLKDGALNTVELDCADFEDNPVHVTLTFENFDNTVLPITITQEALNGKFPTEECGNWASENGDILLTITHDHILLGDTKAENITDGNKGEYSFSVDGKQYSIKIANGVLTLTDDGVSTVLYNCPWYMYIGDFYQNEVDVTIRANSIKVKFKNSAEQTATNITFELVTLTDEYGYPENGYQFEFKLDGKDYVMQQSGYSYDLLVIGEKNATDGLGMYRDKYEELDSWEEYVGTYSGEGYKAELTSDKLTITYNDKSESATKLIFYRDWNYDYPEGFYYQFAFKYGGKDCVLEVVDENTMLLVIDAEAEDPLMFYLTDENYKPDYSQYYGIYEAYSYDEEYHITGVTCQVNFDENGITVKVGEASALNATIVQFTPQQSYLGDGGQFTLKLEDGTMCYMSFWPTVGSYSIYVGEDYYGLSPVTDEAE